MKTYRHKENGKLYNIIHVIKDRNHLNNSEHAGIYADPYTWKGEQIIFYNTNWIECISFIKSNFDLVSEQ